MALRLLIASFVALFFCGGVEVMAAAAQPSDEAWYAILSGEGASIGYASHQVAVSADGIVVSDSKTLNVGERLGSPSAIFDYRSPNQELSDSTQMFENKNERPTKIVKASKLGNYETRTVAEVGTDEVRVTRSTLSDSRTVTVHIPDNVRFDDGDNLLQTKPGGSVGRREFDNFNMSSLSVEHVVIEPNPVPRLPPDRSGLVRTSYRDGALASIAFLTVDANGQILEVAQPMFRTQVTTRLTDRATALHGISMYRMLPSVMTKAPYLISDQAKTGHIRYRFSFPQGHGFSFPQTGEQRALQEQGSVMLDICDDCGPGLASNPEALAQARVPTLWLQSDDKRLRDIAQPIVRSSASETQKMNALLEAAKPYLRKVDFVGHFSALETVDRRSGDCTEASVLLAALARAAGIPAKVVNGLVYSRESYHGVANTFMPHSWTLAFVDGRWRSFDLALGKFDSTHIALTIGDGDERSLSSASQLAGLLGWDSIAEVRKQPPGQPLQ